MRDKGGTRGKGGGHVTGTLAQAANTALPLGACPKGTSHRAISFPLKKTTETHLELQHHNKTPHLKYFTVNLYST